MSWETPCPTVSSRPTRFRPMRNKTPLEFYGTPLPGVDYSELQGKLIVIEGPDSVGRSTQVTRLRVWLEQHGHAVLDTGMARSALAGKAIQEAKKGNTLGPITMTLYYTTDFADRLENEIIPAVRAAAAVTGGGSHQRKRAAQGSREEGVVEHLLRLLQLADSALPVGAAAHSFGLESLIQEGLLGAGELESFLLAYLEESGRLDA